MEGTNSTLQSLLLAIAENAALSCGADDAVIALVDGDHLGVVAHHGSIPRMMTGLAPLDRIPRVGRAVLDDTTIHDPDAAMEADPQPRRLEGARGARGISHRARRTPEELLESYHPGPAERGVGLSARLIEVLRRLAG